MAKSQRAVVMDKLSSSDAMRKKIVGQKYKNNHGI
jgi:hypothetical protein